MKLPLLALGALLFGAAPVAAQEPVVPQSREEIQLTLAPVARAVSPAVVNVYSSGEAERSPLFDDPVLREFFGEAYGPGFDGGRIESSLGSGVLVSADGFIVTNNHVIAQADQIRVVLADLREFEADIVVADERTDLAVLKIEPDEEELPFLEFRDSDTLQVGDLVLAVGNPFGVGQTVTMGIVSAVARTQVGISDYSFFIQTDAAINPGNSGGALVTLDGRLVGINTAIYSRSGGSIGIGFAVPANMVRTVVESAISGEPIARPWAGFVGDTVTAPVAQELGLDRPGGVLVRGLHPQGPAAKAGLQPGDVIVEIGEQRVTDVGALAFRLATLGVGRTAVLTVLRNGSLTLRISLPLSPAPEEPPADIRVLEGMQPLAGATVANLSPALSEELGLRGLWEGVIVLAVERGSPARQLRFQPGDLVLELNGQAVSSVDDLDRRLAEPVSSWLISIDRAGRVVTAEIPAP